MLFEQQLNRIERKAEQIMAAQAQQQTDIDNAVTALTAFLTDLSADVAAIKTELAAAGAPVDTSALNTVIGQIPAAQAALDALARPTPSPTPTSSSAGAGPAA